MLNKNVLSSGCPALHAINNNHINTNNDNNNILDLSGEIVVDVYSTFGSDSLLNYHETLAALTNNGKVVTWGNQIATSENISVLDKSSLRVSLKAPFKRSPFVSKLFMPSAKYLFILSASLL